MEIDNYIRGVTSSPSIAKITEARLKAQAKFKPADRTGRNEYGKYDYATYTDMVNATLTPLVENGLGLPICQIGKDKDGEWVMVGKLLHTTGEWLSTMCPLRDQIDKNGNNREDCQSFESAVTYGQKIVYRCLLGVWFKNGSEDLEQQQEAHSQINAEIAKEKTPPAKTSDLFKKVEAKLKTLVKLPAELAKVMVQAEGLAETGDLTADEMAKIRRQFGQLLPKEDRDVI